MITNQTFNSRNVYLKLKEYYDVKPVKKKTSPVLKNLELSEIEFIFYKGSQRIGDISVCCFGNNKYETHSYSSPKHRNKGLGLFMYTTVADYCHRNNMKLYSSQRNCQSEFARNFWLSTRLRKKYTVRRVSNAWASRWKIAPIDTKTKPRLPAIVMQKAKIDQLYDF